MKKVLLLILIIHHFSTFGQKPNLQFERITDKSGRTLGIVTGISQDKYGYMWFSTRNGLYRYDGYNYKLFRSKTKDSTSLPFNAITRMYYDRSGTFWLKHLDQIAAFKDEKMCYSFSEITQKQFESDVQIIEDKYQNLWIAPTKEGIYRFNRTSKKIENYTHSVPNYNPVLLAIIDSLVQKGGELVTLVDRERKDIVKPFQIKEKDNYLVICVGSSDENSSYDFGSIENNGKAIWNMNPAKTKYAGGTLTNKIQIDILTMTAGKYKGNYIFDRSFSENSNSPNKVSFYGMKIFRLTDGLEKRLQALLNTEYHSPLNISESPIRKLTVDNTGNLVFVSADGLTYFDHQKKIFVDQPINFSQLFNIKNTSDLSIFTLFQDRKNNFWIGTSEGLIKTDGIKYQVFRNINPKDSILSNNTIYCVYEDFEGKIWVGTNNGLNLYDPINQVFHKYKVDNNNRLYDNRINQIFEDNSNNLWIATQEGLNRLKKTKFKFFKLQMDGYNSFPVLCGYVNDLWYHGKQNTLMHYNRSFNVYEKYELNPNFFIIDPKTAQKTFIFNDLLNDNSDLWIAIHGGIHRFDKQKGKVTSSFTVPPIICLDGKRIDNIYAIRKGLKQNLWVFTLQGIYEFDLITYRFTDFITFGLIKKNEIDLDLQYVRYVLKDKNNNFWLRTSSGIQYFNQSERKLTQVLEFDETIRNSSAPDGNICEDKDGNIWLSTMPFVYTIDINTKKNKVFKLEDKVELEVGRSKIMEDSVHNFWIYTDNGLFKYSPENDEFKQYTNKDGLADNDINNVVDDNNGNLLIVSNKAITKLTKRNETFNIISSDFISANFVDVDFSMRDKTGEVLFYTIDGFYSFQPDKINRKIPPIVLTKFSLFGNEYMFDSLLYTKREIDLNYTQNNLSFEFSALDYTDPTENQYSFMLENLDEKWSFCDATDRKATYNALQPGKYVLRIKGTNNDYIWNDKGLAITIIITPPFYKKPWFMALEVIFGILLVVLYIKWRERNLIKEKKILEDKVVERTAEIERQKKEIENQRDIATVQRDQISQQKKEITDSILYASRIQTAILPPEYLINQLLPEHFILNKPRDIVSGDFYWMSLQDEKVYFAVADCTGHGVPGAFMSMLGIAFLNEIITKHEATKANEMLNKLKAHVIKSLHQTGKENEAKDGMDISLSVIDLKNRRVEFSGAYNSLLMIRKGEIIEFKADRMPIGIYFKAQDSFTNHEFDILPGDTLYMLSDGYVDQFGGDHGRKFMSKQFKTLILSLQDKSMAEQKVILNNTTLAWRGETDQIDDILVAGIRF